jgi:nucleoside transporter
MGQHSSGLGHQEWVSIMANQESAQGTSKGTVLDYQQAKPGATGATLALLSTMMFLEFFIWGAWYVTCGNFMSGNGMSLRAVGWAYSVVPIAAIISPFFLGMVADRFFSSERVLGVMSLLSGAAMLGVALVAKADAGTGRLQWLFIGMLLLHALCYTPTLGLTNTVAFHNLTNQEKQFPLIRVFGTLGWIVAGGWVVSKWLGADKKVDQFYITAAACVALGVFSFFLPHTPPPAKGKKAAARDILGLDSLALLKSRSFAVFIIASFLICIPLQAYYAFAQTFVDAAGFKNPGYAMSFGQVAEVFFMVVMPLFFAILGVKWMLLVGMLAWVVRYGLFSAAAPMGTPWMIVFGILLHGICYDFFFVTGFIYTDKKASKEIRGQAQGFLVLVTQGLGMFIGAMISGWLADVVIKKGTPSEVLKSYQQFWLIPCVMAAVIMIAFFLLFKDDGKSREEA